MFPLFAKAFYGGGDRQTCLNMIEVISRKRYKKPLDELLLWFAEHCVSNPPSADMITLGELRVSCVELETAYVFAFGTDRPCINMGSMSVFSVPAPFSCEHTGLRTIQAARDDLRRLVESIVRCVRASQFEVDERGLYDAMHEWFMETYHVRIIDMVIDVASLQSPKHSARLARAATLGFATPVWDWSNRNY